MELTINHTSRTVCDMTRIEKIATNIFEYLNKHFSLNISDSFTEDELDYVMRGSMNFVSVCLFSPSILFVETLLQSFLHAPIGAIEYAGASSCDGNVDGSLQTGHGNAPDSVDFRIPLLFPLRFFRDYSNDWTISLTSHPTSFKRTIYSFMTRKS